jgi:alkylated DNA repair dioxygenase AlkB
MAAQLGMQVFPTDLFKSPPALPDGFRYHSNLISKNEEQTLAEHIAGLPLKEFEFQGFLGKRRIVSFGWRYDVNGGGLLQTDDMPAFLLRVREQAAQFVGISPDRLQHLLLTEYKPGVKIGWHKDRSVFGEVVGIFARCHRGNAPCESPRLQWRWVRDPRTAVSPR